MAVRISFLGTGAGNCIYRAHTAIALDCPDGTRVLLDAGSGNAVLVNGAKLAMFAQDFHQVLLSHHHADHMGGLTHLRGQRDREESRSIAPGNLRIRGIPQEIGPARLALALIYGQDYRSHTPHRSPP